MAIPASQAWQRHADCCPRRRLRPTCYHHNLGPIIREILSVLSVTLAAEIVLRRHVMVWTLHDVQCQLENVMSLHEVSKSHLHTTASHSFDFIALTNAIKY